jgi:starvation-inducible outer membrane lipoprotein
MKKILIIVTLVFTLYGCSNISKEIKNHDISNEKDINVGNFYIYKTIDCKKYLKFLNKFENKKYEIINIDIDTNLRSYTIVESYIITYKKIKKDD